ncbi:MAG: flagellar hook capping FlgD N-terminal domain-containing protein [Chthonomonadales bacterium]
MNTGSVTGAGSAGGLLQAISGNQQLSQQQFLNLLITELQNQDPLSPQDDKQFLAEMAQFSTVQGVTQLGSSMEQLQAAALIGKTVDAVAGTGSGQSAVSGVVQAVQFKQDGVHLSVNGRDVTLDQVVQIRQ